MSGGLNSFTAAGCYLVSRKFASMGGYDNIMSLTPPLNGTLTARFSRGSQSYEIATYDDSSGAWEPAELTVGVGEAMWICLGGGPVPPPPCYLDIKINYVCQLATITWSCPNCQLQQTSVLANPLSATIWTPVSGSSPMTLPIGAMARFFQAACP